MGILETALLALGLSADACAVSLANGMAAPCVGWRDAIKTGLFFGAFQCIMTLIGYFLGLLVADYIRNIDHWIAFGLLSFIGVQMILESRKVEAGHVDCMKTSRLIASAFATSIDALAAGVSLAIIAGSIAKIAISIGLTTFSLSLTGVLLGKRLGVALQKNAAAFGGIVLILIGFSILFNHLGVI